MYCITYKGLSTRIHSKNLVFHFISKHLDQPCDKHVRHPTLDSKLHPIRSAPSSPQNRLPMMRHTCRSVQTKAPMKIRLVGAVTRQPRGEVPSVKHLPLLPPPGGHLHHQLRGGLHGMGTPPPRPRASCGQSHGSPRAPHATGPTPPV